MELYHEIKEKAFILILCGNLDGYNAGEINRMLKKAVKSRKENILVDCRNLQTVSSSGIGAFLSHLPDFKAHQINLVFFGLSLGVRKAFTFLGVDAIFTINDELPEAFFDAALS